MRATIIIFIALLIIVANGCGKTASAPETSALDTSERGKAEFIFADPVNLGSVVNSIYHEGSPDISSDGTSLYFDSLRPDGLGNWDIWLIRAKTPHYDWGSPEVVPPPVNSRYGESGPCISAGGLSLYFASDRPGGYGDFDIWVATRKTTEDPWEEPVNLGPNVNSWAYDNHPSISSGGLSLYFDSRRPNPSGSLGNNDLYVSTRSTTADDWSIPTNLGPKINTSKIQYSPNILSDGMTMFFDSRITNRDIWMTTRRNPNDDWDTAVPLEPPMNTSYIDTDPSISVDGSIIYFVSNRPGGNGGFDLWQARITKNKNTK
ncbi:MAG TPA: hypothetical protein DIU00_02570 [Phycisphaerales bacterium]|nr:hypothetical protein [Phycisphaerales bacterium]